MLIEKFGPLFVWTALFIVGAVIKTVAFSSSSVWYDLPHEASLWSVGVLLAEATAERFRSGAMVNPRITKKTGGEIGYDISYQVTLPDDPRFSARPVYMAFFGMALWIVALILALYAEVRLENSPPPFKAKFAIVASYVCGIVSLLMAGRTFLEPQLGGGQATGTSSVMEKENEN